MGGEQQLVGFFLRLAGEWQMDGHLVAIKVRVKGRADQWVKTNGIALDQHRLKCLDAQAVQRRSAVEQHNAGVHDLFQNIPDRGMLPFYCAFCLPGVWTIS